MSDESNNPADDPEYAPLRAAELEAVDRAAETGRFEDVVRAHLCTERVLLWMADWHLRRGHLQAHRDLRKDAGAEAERLRKLEKARRSDRIQALEDQIEAINDRTRRFEDLRGLHKKRKEDPLGVVHQ
jgi:hypothetical protein